MSILIKRFSKYIDKLYFKQWAIGFCQADIREIIRTKSFEFDISWLPVKLFKQFYADPFVYRTSDGNYDILCEDYNFKERYGKIAVISIDPTFKQIREEILLDTKSHLSYPFIFVENNKIYVFPESGRSAGLSCYEYDPLLKTLSFVKKVVDLPLIDSTILKFDNKYWLFGTLLGNGPDKNLNIYYSSNLLGPYRPHLKNPVKSAIASARPAGNFIEVDGQIYRPSQNCEKWYGESITINRITLLNEIDFSEEPYMMIRMDKDSICKYGIHTINSSNNIIVIDGQKWTLSPLNQLRSFARKMSWFP